MLGHETHNFLCTLSPVHQAQVVVRLAERGKRARRVVNAHGETVWVEVDARGDVGEVAGDGEVEGGS